MRFQLPAEGVEEQVADAVVGSDEEGFPVVGELEAGPRGRLVRAAGSEVEVVDLERRKGRLVVVAEIV